MNIRVYYEDTDCGNMVYYANYLCYMERSRTELLRERGINLRDYHDQNIFFGVVDVHVKYRAPARYDDLLSVESTITRIASLLIEIRSDIRLADSHKLLVTGEVKLVCMDEKGKARKIPPEMVRRLEEGNAAIRC